MRGLPFYGGKDIVCAIEVSVYCRELVFKGVRYEALGGQMVALIWLYVGNNVKDGRIALHGSAVDLDSIQEVPDTPHPRLGMLDGYPPYNPMDFIPFFKK